MGEDVVVLWSMSTSYASMALIYRRDGAEHFDTHIFAVSFVGACTMYAGGTASKKQSDRQDSGAFDLFSRHDIKGVADRILRIALSSKYISNKLGYYYVHWSIWPLSDKPQRRAAHARSTTNKTKVPCTIRADKVVIDISAMPGQLRLSKYRLQKCIPVPDAMK
jgi:hypothetical protein